MHGTTIAVDLAKSVFEVAISNKPGRVERRRRLSRAQFTRLLGQEPSATVVMEACGTAHFWGRCARDAGHRVILLPPHGVRPYVLRNKTDGADAKALLEASRNRDLRPVPLKTPDPPSIHNFWSYPERDRACRNHFLQEREEGRCGPTPEFLL